MLSLYSGGKDSTYALVIAKEMGHDISCLLTMHPATDASLLFHYPNSWVTSYLGEAMSIPSFGFAVQFSTKEDELRSLEQAIIAIKSLHEIHGVVHGGIFSRFQSNIVQRICSKHNLAVIAPLWHIQQSEYMDLLLEKNFDIKIVSVSAMGLDEGWLGISLDREALHRLKHLSKKYSFSVCFEGGEAETLVIDCPIFYKKLKVRRANIHWDGQRGIFEILEVGLEEK
ncbi:MAG TPA: diphthine--ammonia ligase [Candidatus Nitrosopolaris sp.]|nr:diphthine--ammonia ligase [Candidatus Nitrosopolaris sp.]